jgi:cell division protein FtsZ
MSEMGMAMMGSGRASGEGRAQEAAEAAIASPLLEDVNLAGARGILVNVTAGMDLAIGEFEEVGNIIKSFASENATVVVGTVIDPELSGELRVTVVATGLGAGIDRNEKPKLVVDRTNSGDVDYEKLDRPTVIRKKASGDKYDTEIAGNMDYLDIPAFLRRQAD